MAQLNREEIKRIIPHRSPMLLVDTVEELEPGERVVTTYRVEPDSDVFKGHFPDDPMLPGVYTVECMAQAADILLLSLERYAGKKPLFIGIDKVRFTKKIRQGDVLRVEAEKTWERLEKGIATCSAKGYVDGELAISGELTLAMRN